MNLGSLELGGRVRGVFDWACRAMIWSAKFEILGISQRFVVWDPTGVTAGMDGDGPGLDQLGGLGMLSCPGCLWAGVVMVGAAWWSERTGQAVVHARVGLSGTRTGVESGRTTGTGKGMRRETSSRW